MRGSIVFFTAVLSVIFLKRKQYRHHITGLILVISGITIVGVVSVTMSKEEDTGAKTEFFGVILLLISQITAGFMFIIEEKLFHKYYIDPMKAVGWEGVTGLTITGVFLIVA
jgi:drug/metabolite transporter (DMT)-like permease